MANYLTVSKDTARLKYPDTETNAYNKCVQCRCACDTSRHNRQVADWTRRRRHVNDADTRGNRHLHGDTESR